jgi:GAF domain-containing protein
MLIGPMLQRMRAAAGLEETLRVALKDVVALHGAERGNVQLLNASGQLLIVQQMGLSRRFLQAFERVDLDDGSVCGRAALRQETVFVADVEEEAEFRRFVPIARSVPFRSVLSSPLTDPSAGLVGMVSVHFANRFRPTALELDSLEAYCRHVAQALVAQHGARGLREVAESLSAGLLEVAV